LSLTTKPCYFIQMNTSVIGWNSLNIFWHESQCKRPVSNSQCVTQCLIGFCMLWQLSPMADNSCLLRGNPLEGWYL
jgi:hypothetical protein